MGHCFDTWSDQEAQLWVELARSEHAQGTAASCADPPSSDTGLAVIYLDGVATTYISNDADYAATSMPVPHVSLFPRHVGDEARDLIAILH